MNRASARTWLVRALGPMIVAAVCGCGSVRVVSETSDGGVVAMPIDCNRWPMNYRDQADKIMSAKCPDGYQIDHEEYVSNGIAGPAGHRYHDSYFGYTDPDDETAPYLREEFRITYHATPPPAPPAPKPPSSPQKPDAEELPPPRLLKGGQE